MKKARLMNKKWKIPPANKHALSAPTQLANRLQTLIDRKFPLTGKSRTDGSNIRKLVAATLRNHPLPEPAKSQNYEIVPPRKKGVPKILREFIDTYIVTTGNSYNLQVWNRNPSSESVQVRYSDGSVLSARDVRFVFVPVDPVTKLIQSVVILSPDYIQANFGPFGKPTIKHQLIVPGTARDAILSLNPSVLVGTDTNRVEALATSSYAVPTASIHDAPQAGKVFGVTLVAEMASQHLLGMTIPPGSTKNRGQALEKVAARLLGYTKTEALLAGEYPDILNQLLEVKIQDSPTVDLGLYSPQFEEILPAIPNVTTRDVRYLIALMDTDLSGIAGLIICAGADLGKHFTYVAEGSYKCQRSIPMDFFKSLKGKSIFNP